MDTILMNALELGTYGFRISQMVAVVTGCFLKKSSAGVSWAFILCKMLTYVGRFLTIIEHSKYVRFPKLKLGICLILALSGLFALTRTRYTKFDEKVLKQFLIPLLFISFLVTSCLKK